MTQGLPIPIELQTSYVVTPSNGIKVRFSPFFSKLHVKFQKFITSPHNLKCLVGSLVTLALYMLSQHASHTKAPSLATRHSHRPQGHLCHIIIKTLFFFFNKIIIHVHCIRLFIYLSILVLYYFFSLQNK